jgi:hypothetical protein
MRTGPITKKKQLSETTMNKFHVHKRKFQKLFKFPFTNKNIEYKQTIIHEDETRQLVFHLVTTEENNLIFQNKFKQKIRVYSTQDNKLEFLFSLKDFEIKGKIYDFLKVESTLLKDVDNEDIINISCIKRQNSAEVELMIMYNSGMRVYISLEKYLRRQKQFKSKLSSYPIREFSNLKLREGCMDPSMIIFPKLKKDQSKNKQIEENTYKLDIEYNGYFDVKAVKFMPWAVHEMNLLQNGLSQKLYTINKSVNLNRNEFLNSWSFPGGTAFSKIVEGKSITPRL